MSPEQVTSAYFAGVNEERYADVAALFAPGGTLAAPGTEPRGGEEIAAYFAAALAPYPVHHDDPVRTVVAGSTVTVEIHFSGELESGAPLEFDAIDVFDLDPEGRIVKLTSWYDSHEVRKKLLAARGDARPRPLVVALVGPRVGEEQAFNQWYVEHLEEVGEVPGVRSARRYRLAAGQAEGMEPPPNEWLAIYELDAEPEAVLGELVRRRAAGEWRPRRGIDEETIGMWSFEPVAEDGGPV